MKEMPCMSFSSLVYICLILPFTLLERKQKRKKKCVVSEILQGGSKMTSTSENRPFFLCVCVAPALQVRKSTPISENQSHFGVYSHPTGKKKQNGCKRKPIPFSGVQFSPCRPGK